MKPLSILACAFIFSTCGKKDNPPVPDPPVIVKAFPNSNAVNGPVMIEGTFQDITSIKFNGKEALQDTIATASLTDLAIPLEPNVTGIVTTRVPAGLTPGTVTLTITSKNGTSANYSFTVLSVAPSYPVSPATIKVKPKAKYIPAVFNYWTNEVKASNYIFIKSGTPPKGDQTLTLISNDLTQDNFVVTHVPSVTDKTIEVLVTHKGGVTEKLSGIYADSDLLPRDNPPFQRIIFYDKDGRQIVVHVQI